MSAIDKAIKLMCATCGYNLCNGNCWDVRGMRIIIAEAQLEAVEKWMAMTYDCIGNNGVISNEHFNYLAALRKAAGKGE